MNMMFWNLLQDHRFFKLRDRTDTIEGRVKGLETRITDLQDLMKKILYALETHLGEDIDKDGRVGKPPTKRIVIKNGLPDAKKK